MHQHGTLELDSKNIRKQAYNNDCRYKSIHPRVAKTSTEQFKNFVYIIWTSHNHNLVLRIITKTCLYATTFF